MSASPHLGACLGSLDEIDGTRASSPPGFAGLGVDPTQVTRWLSPCELEGPSAPAERRPATKTPAGAGVLGWPVPGVAMDYLTFSDCGAELGLALERILAVSGPLPSTAVPGAPPSVHGLVAWRGQVVPVVDLSIQLGGPPTAPAPRACLLFVEPRIEEEPTLVGMLVESVGKIISPRPEEIDRHPLRGRLGEADFLSGVTAVEERLVQLVDLDALLALSRIHAAVPASAERGPGAPISLEPKGDGSLLPRPARPSTGSGGSVRADPPSPARPSTGSGRADLRNPARGAPVEPRADRDFRDPIAPAPGPVPRAPPPTPARPRRPAPCPARGKLGRAAPTPRSHAAPIERSRASEPSVRLGLKARSPKGLLLAAAAVALVLLAVSAGHVWQGGQEPSTRPAAQPDALPATALPTTALPTTALPTTALPTTALPTTALPTTALPTTALPTTAPAAVPTPPHAASASEAAAASAPRAAAAFLPPEPIRPAPAAAEPGGFPQPSPTVSPQPPTVSPHPLPDVTPQPPEGSPHPSPVRASLAPAPAPPDSEAAVEVYEVRKGDTLWDLSSRYNGSPWRWHAIFRENRDVIANPDLIRPGQRIRIRRR
jgi:purine-binding chemotaxis protein CheW